MNERVELKRVHSGEGVSVYEGEDGAKYMLKVVDREYSGTRRGPAYYLTRQRQGERKPTYLTGLFRTSRKGVLSGDLKDELGVRQLFAVIVENEGEKATIQPGDHRENGGDRGRQQAETAKAAASR